MKLVNGYRMRLILVGFVAAVVLGGGNVKADFTFGEPTNLGPIVNSSAGDCPSWLSADGLEMYLISYRPGTLGNFDTWVTTRSTKDDPWGEPVNLGPPISSGSADGAVCISADGLELYLYRFGGGYGQSDIYVATRETKDDKWSQAVNLGQTVNSSRVDLPSWISPDGLELYFDSERPGGFGGYDIWVTRRTTRNDPWDTPVNLGPVVNSAGNDNCAFISANGRLLFFSGERTGPVRPGGFGGSDMWVTTRRTLSEPWSPPVNLGPVVNSSSYDGVPRISPDGSTLYFSSERPGGYGGQWGDIYQAPIIPIVDFNGDGIVDSVDMCIMVEHWLTDYPLCDIGPMPWGDGIVDVQDLIVLAEHLFEEFPPVEPAE